MLEDMASNNYQWPIERSVAKKVAGVYEVDQFTALSTQISTLSNQFVAFTTQGVGRKKKTIMENISYLSAEINLK